MRPVRNQARGGRMLGAAGGALIEVEATEVEATEEVARALLSAPTPSAATDSTLALWTVVGRVPMEAGGS